MDDRLQDRLQLLLDAGEWEESLAAALELYERRAGSAAQILAHVSQLGGGTSIYFFVSSNCFSV